MNVLNKDIIGFLFRLLNARNALAVLLLVVRINNPIVTYRNISENTQKNWNV